MMENGAESVIAKLMGFDDKPPQYQPVSGHQKVFSDKYLQKYDYCIGKRSRKDSQNPLLRSKKRANLRSSDLDKDLLLNDAMQGMQSPIVFNSVNNGERLKSGKKIRPNLASVEYGFGPSFLRDSQTVFAWEVKKQLLERLKLTKVSQSDFGSLIGVKEGWKNESVVKLPVFKPLSFSSKSDTESVKTTRSDVKTSFGKLVSNSEADAGIKKAESFRGDTITEDKCDCSAKEECSSHVSGLSSEQDSPIVSHEYASVYSDCLQRDEEHPDGKGEIYQRSPISVLEPPFREDNSSSSEYCGSMETDLHGLWMQLQLLKSESEENEINPEMVTSSDDERSCTDENIQLMIPFGTKESRDFSYLVDVLDESGFQDGDMEIRFERWHSSETMASPLVFEMLEKKYGKQELWHKAERRLLFDRINAGMTEIVRPHVDIRACSKPLRRKMANILRRDVIEEELLDVLVGQEKGVNDGLSEKAVGRGPWFDPVEELDSLVREIEIFLFDQLAAELVSA